MRTAPGNITVLTQDIVNEFLNFEKIREETRYIKSFRDIASKTRNYEAAFVYAVE